MKSNNQMTEGIKVMSYTVVGAGPPLLAYCGLPLDDIFITHLKSI